MIKHFAFISFIFILFMPTSFNTFADESLEILQKAPAFILKTLDGNEVVKSRDIFSEKKLTVLIFWDSYCPDCLKAVADCQKFYQYSKENNLDVNVYSINFDDEKLSSVRRFVRGEGITFPILSDKRKIAVSRYKAKAYDFSFFIIDNKGTIQYINYDHPPDVSNVIKEVVLKLLKERLKVKESAPSFKLKTLDGSRTIKSEEVFSQTDLTILIFWNIKCKESLDAVVEYQKLYKKMKKINVGFLSVNFDKKNEMLQSFANKMELEYPILSDADEKVVKLYKAEDLCFSVFVIDKKGIIRYISYKIPEKIDEIEEQIKKLRTMDENM
ncbi:redoxin domain-containing protein [Candidatus Poribacteria bacterium]|nr:redoxin domain-containing protein [Candidatus Poribacteria bacterium]